MRSLNTIQNELTEALQLLGHTVVTDAIINLIKAGKGGGKLQKSLGFKVTANEILFTGEHYGYWVDKGRKPKRKQPPLKDIKGWILATGNIPLTAAFPIARKIGKKGIKGTFFLSKAIRSSGKDLKKIVRKLLEEVELATLKSK